MRVEPICIEFVEAGYEVQDEEKEVDGTSCSLRPCLTVSGIIEEYCEVDAHSYQDMIGL